ARVERRAAGVFIEDMGALSGTLVNGERVAQFGPLSSGDSIVIGPCLIRLCQDDPGPPVLSCTVQRAIQDADTPAGGAHAAQRPAMGIPITDKTSFPDDQRASRPLDGSGTAPVATRLAGTSAGRATGTGNDSYVQAGDTADSQSQQRA